MFSQTVAQVLARSTAQSREACAAMGVAAARCEPPCPQSEVPAAPAEVITHLDYSGPATPGSGARSICIANMHPL